jgi:hypothetical protein
MRWVLSERKDIAGLIFFSKRLNHTNEACRLTQRGGNKMPKYVIERELPGAGKLSQQEIQGISQKSCEVLTNLGPQIQWVQSYVTDDKIYCIYIAPNKGLIEKHAKEGGFPANTISEVKRIIDPTTAEE